MYVVFNLGHKLEVVSKNSSRYLDLSTTMEPIYEGTQKECNKFVDNYDDSDY